MKTLLEKIRDLSKPKHGCPKELHWLGIGLQVWAVGIFLYTFSDGFFISRIFLTGQGPRGPQYYHYPQFYYVIVGCTALPLTATFLKKRSRLAWAMLVVLMSSVVSSCVVMMVPEINELARVNYATVIGHFLVAMNVIVLLAKNRGNLFLSWETTPEWVEKGRKTIEWRKLVTVDFINWKKELVDGGFLLLRTFAMIAALVAGLFLLNDLIRSAVRDVGRFFSMSDAIQRKSVWRQRLIIRTFPLSLLMRPICLCRNDYYYEAMEMGDLDTAKIFDGAYVELFKYSDRAALDEARVRGLTNAIYLKKDEMIRYYYGLNADRLTPNSSYYCMSAAVTTGNLREVKRLLKRGHRLSVASPWGMDGLVEDTIYNEHQEMAEWLIAHGLDPDARDRSGETALFSAIRYDRLEMADLLVKHGADPKAVDATGNTLFHAMAASYWEQGDEKLPETVNWLKEHGLSPNALNDNWDKPADLVSAGKKEAWINLVENRAPRPKDKNEKPSWIEELQVESSE